MVEHGDQHLPALRGAMRQEAERAGHGPAFAVRIAIGQNEAVPSTSSPVTSMPKIETAWSDPKHRALRVHAADHLAAPDSMRIGEHDIDRLHLGWAARKASASAGVEPVGEVIFWLVLAIFPSPVRKRDRVEGWTLEWKNDAASTAQFDAGRKLPSVALPHH